MDDDTSLHLARKELQKLVFVLDLTKPIVLPVVLIVLINLPVERVRERFLTVARQ